MIIWGSKAKVHPIGAGTFFCPNCSADSPYSHERISRYFTLYFIPLFPTATLGQYVQCRTCGMQFPEAILTCTREDIAKATRPWVCPKCNNHNPPAQGQCLGCGQMRTQPPPLPRASPTPVPPTRHPTTGAPAPSPSARRKLSGIEKTFLIGGPALVLFALGFGLLRGCQFAQYARTHNLERPRDTFHSATDLIGPLGLPASGNTGEAIKLAQIMANDMSRLRKTDFTQFSKQSVMDRHDVFRVYCHLQPGQCVFLVHVPELRHFDSEAQTSMANLAWEEAHQVLRRSQTADQPMKLAIGIRGNLLYDRVLLGRFAPATGQERTVPPQVERGSQCENLLAEWFASPLKHSPPKLESGAGGAP
jgi:hypothetical protein